MASLWDQPQLATMAFLNTLQAYRNPMVRFMPVPATSMPTALFVLVLDLPFVWITVDTPTCTTWLVVKPGSCFKEVVYFVISVSAVGCARCRGMFRSTL